MAEVVGKSTAISKKATCAGCGSIVRYYKNDVASYKSYDYTGDFDVCYKITCPGCGKDVGVKQWFSSGYRIDDEV